MCVRVCVIGCPRKKTHRFLRCNSAVIDGPNPFKFLTWGDSQQASKISKITVAQYVKIKTACQKIQNH